jgi:hypothetical protein
MSDGLDFALRACLIGAGGTAVMDLWAALLWHMARVPALDYAPVGR